MKQGDDSMNQSKTRTVGERAFISRLEFSAIWLSVLVIAGLQGCDNSGNVSVERPANLDRTVTEVVVAPAELKQQTPLLPVKNNPTAALSNGDSSFPDQEEGKSDVSPKQSTEKPVTDNGEDDSVLSKAGKMVGDAASKSVKSASDAGQWVQETLGDATKTGTKSAADTWEWANETFESLKAQGLTSAQSTSQWLGQDWKNMESWQYQIVILEGEPADVAKKLNELGEQGWECFEVTDLTSTSTKFYLKKPTFSYLRQLPFKDVIKLVPLMNAGEK